MNTVTDTKTVIALENVSVKLPYKGQGNSLFKKKLFSANSENSNYLEILKDINLELKVGDKVGLVGNNGAGKTTLLRVLATVLPPTSGSVNLYGKVLPLLNSNFQIMPELTCRQNIKLIGLRNKLQGEKLEEYMSEVLHISALEKFIDSPVRILSAGMKNRLVLSLLYGDQSDIVVMDEWIGASDQKVLERKEGLLRDLIHNSKVFILASHREKIIAEHCNKVIKMENGQIASFEEI